MRYSNMLPPRFRRKGNFFIKSKETFDFSKKIAYILDMRSGIFFGSFLITTAWGSSPIAPAISNSPNSPYRQLSVLLEDMAHMKERIESVEDQVSQVLGNNSKTSAFADEVEKQKLALSQLNAKEKELQEQMGASLRENEILKAQIVSLQRQLSDSQTKYQAVQNALKQMEFSWEEAKKDLRTLTEVQTKQASHMEVLERTGAAAKVVQQHNEQIQAMQAALKQQVEECGALKLAIAKSTDQVSNITGLKQRIDEIGESLSKLKEQNVDKTLLLGKISEENEGLRHRFEQMAPTTALVQQQHEKIKQLTEGQQDLQGKLLQQSNSYALLKESLEKNSNTLALDLHQQVNDIRVLVNGLRDHNLDKTAILEQISEEAQARKMMFEQLTMANDALKAQIKSGTGSKPADWLQLKKKLDDLAEEGKSFKTAQAALEQHYRLFFDEVNRQLKSIEGALSQNPVDASGSGSAQLNQLQEQFNSLKKDLGDKWKDLSDRCKNMCASTLTQANDRLQSLAQQMQTNFDHLREKSFTRHVILSGESLTSIAKQYQTTPTKILSINNLPNAKNLHVGDVLLIPNDM